jgi:hypothetical protein
MVAFVAGVANADTVIIDVELDGHELGTYRLNGQSAFIQTRTGSGTSGGQLDGVVTGGTSIGFFELFPPPSLADYLGFAYFGIIETLDDSANVIDTSLVVAFDSGVGTGATIDPTFPYDEATLVAAMTGPPDSAEFLDMLDLVPANATTLGDVAVPPIGRPGSVQDLVAFIGGPNGDIGVKVGQLSVTVVPEPSALALAAAGMVAVGIVARRRR